MTMGLPSRGPNSARHISMSLSCSRPDTAAGGSSGVRGSTVQGCSADQAKPLTAKAIQTIAALRVEDARDMLLHRILHSTRCRFQLEVADALADLIELALRSGHASVSLRP